MPAATVTLSVEINAAPDDVFALLQDVRAIPDWAPLFADAVSPDTGDRWTATKDGQDFSLRVAIIAEARCVDYLRQIAPGREGGAYLRVQPRPGGGAVVVMTIPMGPAGSADEVGAILRDELKCLAELAERRFRRP